MVWPRDGGSKVELRKWMNEIKDKLERSVVYILSSILHRTVSYLFAAMKPKFIPAIYSTLRTSMVIVHAFLARAWT